MEIKTDIQIAQEATPLKITEVAKSCGIDEKYIEQYGNYKAKIALLCAHNAENFRKLLLRQVLPAARVSDVFADFHIAGSFRSMRKRFHCV